MARKHVYEDGCSFGSFAGKYHMSVSVWERLGRTIPELIEIKAEYNDRVRHKRKSPLIVGEYGN
jgi:hypothetical protein